MTDCKGDFKEFKKLINHYNNTHKNKISEDVNKKNMKKFRDLIEKLIFIKK